MKTFLLTTALVSLITPLASGAIVISAGSGGGNPDSNILFQGTGVVLGPALTVTGRTNDTSWLLDFTSTDQIQADGGQALIESAVNGGTFGDILTNNFRDPAQLSAVAMTDLKFLVDIIDSAADSNLRIDVYSSMDGSGPIVATANLGYDNKGNNFYRVVATGGDVFGSVRVTDLNGDNFFNYQQIRVTGTRVGPVVPEASSLVAWGICAAFGAFVAYRRRRAC